jgi:hypothetical protein
MQHLDEGSIHSWLDGALSADEAAQVEAHVTDCPKCEAAVAEARGFIAASSRILTALDHVPAGVVPAARSGKWHNRAAWRAAAAVLVVAVGSLVVVRNSDRKPALATASSDTIGVPNAAATQPQGVGPPPEAAPMRELQIPAAVAPSTRRAVASGAAAPGKPTAEADFSGKGVSSAAQPKVIARSQVEGAATLAPQSAAPPHVAEVTMRDAANEQAPLKVVGHPRTLGARVTLYEVAPGDTVTLTEPLELHLDVVVVTGVGSPPLMGRVAGKSAAAPAQRANAAAVVSPPDSQSRVKAANAPGLPSQVEVVNGVTTITWPDARTGNMLKLSGRMSVEQLEEIKLRIERERAAAAAKKGP